jgi:hypothetical protein
MDAPSPAPWKFACALVLAVPLAWFAVQAAGHNAGPVCADHTGANGYAGPGFAILGSEPRPACIRDELPPLSE